MLLSQLNNQETKKILVDLLFKKGYCLCIPDTKLIKSRFEQVSPTWLQKLFLSKNAFGLSVIPMFMLIFVKNKHLTADQSKHLLELLQVLMSQAEIDTIDQIFFDTKVKRVAWAYYILDELLKFTLDDFVISDKYSSRIMTMAECIAFFFDKASVVAITKLTLNTENTGFNVIHKLMYVIAYENLHPNQVTYLSNISKKIIDKTTNFELQTLIFQTQRNGYSFIWCVLGTWLQLVFECENSNQFKVGHYTQLINFLFEKIDCENLSSILLENETKGYIIILRYLFFKRFELGAFHYDLTESFTFFKQWCKKIFSILTIQQIEFILDNLPLLLINDLSLSNDDRRYLIRNFFAYLFEFCKLQPQEIALLKDFQERIEERFPSRSKIIKFFRQVRAPCHFFNCTHFRNLINKEDEISLDESSHLLSPYCARLNPNYLTVSL